MNKEFETPILFLIFNRVDTTHEVFKEIKNQRPKYLYIASDGPRGHVLGEEEVIYNLRQSIINEIDWDCEVHTLFREENLGCGKGVSGAITWFFKNVEQGIILEDDCLPQPAFFDFCDEMLDYYKNDAKVYEISGSNLQAGKVIGDGSYYFSNYVGIWGWATWARAWNKYDYEMKNYNRFAHEKQIVKIFADKKQQKYWTNILKKATSINTWDYQWVFTIWLNDGISIIPNTNLIKNIGFNNNGTHILAEPDWYKKLTSGYNNIFPIIHPSKKEVSKIADDFCFTQTSKSSILKKIRNIVSKIKNA